MSSSEAKKNKSVARDTESDLFTAKDSSKVLEALSLLTLAVNNLPVADSREVALLTNPKLDADFQASRTNLSRLINSVAQPSTKTPTTNTTVAGPEAEAMVHIHSQVLEHSLEKANGALDLAVGFRDTPLTDAESKAGATATTSPKTKPVLGPRLPESYKPQYAFRDQPLDNSSAPFVPPFVKSDFTPVPPSSPEPSEDGGDASGSEDDSEAVKDGDVEVVKKSDCDIKKGDGCDSKIEDDSGAVKEEDDIDLKTSTGDSESKNNDSKRKKKYRKPKKREKVVSLHPFRKEIKESIADNIAKEPFSADDVIVQKPMDKTPFTFVDSAKDLLAVAERFAKCTEIAVDLEHHNRRTFLGFTCLIQMSTRLEDVVVDVLNIPSGTVHSALAPIFADPTVTKVLHGADNDIEWLERDYGLYIVNMFDTGQAARVLQYPNASLAYLLNLYCQVKADGKKSFQRADWRIRPIPKSMLNYARSDTHYLLYIYDRVRLELYQKTGDEVRQVYEKSGGVSLHRFRKPLFVPGRALKVATKKGLCFDKYQVAILESLFRWRDDTSRLEDESQQYLARDAWLIAVARAKDKARTPEGLLRVLSLAAINARFVKKYHVQVARIIANTLDSDVPPLPEKKKPREKTAESTSTSTAEDSTPSTSGSSSNSSQSSTPSKLIKKKKKSNKHTATSPQDSKAKQTKLNPTASVFTPAQPKSKASKSKPSVCVHGKNASLLFESDTGTTSSASEQINGSQRSTSPVVEGETSLMVKESNFPSLGGAKAAIVTSAKKSVFILSESDAESVVDAQTLEKPIGKGNDGIVMNSETGAKEGSRNDNDNNECSTVAKVKASMARADNDMGFSELWKNGKEEADTNSGKKEQNAKAEAEKGVEESEEEILALSSSRKSKKKKKKKPSSAAKKKEITGTVEALKPYDYLGDIEQDKKKKKTDDMNNKGKKANNEVFKAMNQGKQNKTRRSKKNPASGSRSMTFSAK